VCVCVCVCSQAATIDRRALVDLVNSNAEGHPGLHMDAALDPQKRQQQLMIGTFGCRRIERMFDGLLGHAL